MAAAAATAARCSVRRWPAPATSCAPGWTVGGGFEYAFTNNVSARIEGLYVNLDRDNNGFAGTVNGVPVFGPNASTRVSK